MTPQRFLVRVPLMLAAFAILSCQAADAEDRTSQLVPTYSWVILHLPPHAVQTGIFYGNMDTLLQRQGMLFTVPSSSKHDETQRVGRHTKGATRAITRDASRHESVSERRVAMLRSNRTAG